MEENKNTTPPPYTPPTEKPQPTEKTQPTDKPQPPQCVNKGKPIYFSYARNSDEKPEWNHIADCVDKLTEIFKEQNIEYRVNDTAETSASISDYEQHIGWDSDVIVLVFSDRYFRSLHCMYEFVQIKNAIKKYPQKRLFCIKSGDFNLSDINYILDLEHFWGDQKQEYDEVSYHKTRPITNVEEAAHTNGFYMDDIRSLYSFFSTLNYANANSQDWNEFAKDIADCYSITSKVTQLVMEKVKQRKTKLKFIGFGCLAWVLMPLVMLIGFFIVIIIYAVPTSNPSYTQGLDYLNVSQLLLNITSTDMTLKLVNPYDKDTIVYATRGFYLEVNGIQYHLEYTTDMPLYPEYKVLAPHETIEYELSFPKIPRTTETVDFVMFPEIGIYGIKIGKKDD